MITITIDILTLIGIILISAIMGTAIGFLVVAILETLKNKK